MEEKDLQTIINELTEKLSIIKLTEVLKGEDLEKFYTKVIPALKKYNYEIDIENFYNFSKSLGLNEIETIYFIRENPQVITQKGFKEFLNKYIFLSVVENETNTQRLRHMKKTPKDFHAALEVLYSKYHYMKEFGVETNWSTLIRQKPERIEKKIKNNGGTPLTIENIKRNYPYDEKYIEELKLLAINNFGVLNDKKRSK